VFAFLHVPPSSERNAAALASIAGDFSPRFELHGTRGAAIDLHGLERMFARPAPSDHPPVPHRFPSVWHAIGEELRRACVDRGLRVQIGITFTWTAAAVVAHARPGMTVIGRGREAAALSTIRIEVLRACRDTVGVGEIDLGTFERWGIRTLGELAAIAPADLVARFGRPAAGWHAVARGEDCRPLMPAVEEERFDASMDLEWPIEGLEPLSFVLTRLLEPLETRLERRDRGAAVLHVILGLALPRSATARGSDGARGDVHARRLDLPAPMRDVRTLRTLALLDLESHPPDAPIQSVSIVIEPTPGRIVQHTLFTRAHPTPERVSTLVARLGALTGHDRIGAPALVDSYRPGAFTMKPFTVASLSNPLSAEHPPIPVRPSSPPNPANLLSALRRCRQPVPARVVVDDGRPIRVTTDRRGFAGGAVIDAAGPWRTSGEWWEEERPAPPAPCTWDRDEWDVALGDGGVYRIFRDRESEAWFIDAIVD
jgi:protein ImuB